jgi:lysozyme
MMESRKTRLPIAAALAAAITVGVLVSHTTKQEGTGPVEQVTVQQAIERGTVGMMGKAAEGQFLHLAKTQMIPIMRAYPDPGYGWKVPTICYGHTRGVTRGMTATKEQCEQWLIEDYESLVFPVLERCVKVPVSVGEAVALADFVFNVGPKFCKSTLANKLNAGDRQGAADEFGKWVYSNGRRLPGLVDRNLLRRKIFLSQE